MKLRSNLASFIFSLALSVVVVDQSANGEYEKAWVLEICSRVWYAVFFALLWSIFIHYTAHCLQACSMSFHSVTERGLLGVTDSRYLLLVWQVLHAPSPPPALKVEVWGILHDMKCLLSFSFSFYIYAYMYHPKQWPGMFSWNSML